MCAPISLHDVDSDKSVSIDLSLCILASGLVLLSPVDISRVTHSL